MVDLTRILNFVEDKCNYFNMLPIEIIEDNNFYTVFDILKYTISITNMSSSYARIQDRYFISKMTDECKNIYWMIDNEVIPFLHELGHIYYEEQTNFKEDEKEVEYLKNSTWKSKEEYYINYRQIAGEKMADDWAINFLNEYCYEIASICNNCNIEDIKFLCA